MKAVILVGGEGLRLRPLTCNIPKPMVPIVNRPFLEHLLDYLKQHHIDEVLLCLFYLPDQIRRHFGDGEAFGVKLKYAVEDTPLGTAGAVKNVEQELDDTFFVFNGDIFTDMDLTALLAFHRENKASATIALTPVENPTIYGVVECDERGRVLRFVEKPSWDAVTTNMINAGVYVLEPDVLELVPAATHYMFEYGLFPALLERRRPVFGYPSSAYWMDIGTPQKYLDLHHHLLMGRTPVRFSGHVVAPSVWLGRGCTVDPSAKLEGPLVVGEGCAIELGAEVSGPTVLGPSCTIGQQCIIEGSVLWRNVRLGCGAALKNSIVASDVVIGEDAWASDAVIGAGAVVGRGRRLERGIKVWPEENIKSDPSSS